MYLESLKLIAATYYGFQCYGLQPQLDVTWRIRLYFNKFLSWTANLWNRSQSRCFSEDSNLKLFESRVIFPLYPHNVRLLSITSTIHTANSIRNPLSRVTPRPYIWWPIFKKKEKKKKNTNYKFDSWTGQCVLVIENEQ